MPNYALVVEYDGALFYGWQKQKKLKTVQGTLDEALAVVLRRNPPSRIFVAGRTDTGVHSLGMVCNFRTLEPIPNLHKLIVSINALSGKGVSIRNAIEVPNEFHSRFSCDAREYVYQIYHGKYENPLLKNRAYWLKFKVDWEKVEKELPTLLGEKDFSSFAKATSIRGKKTVRKILSVNLEKDNFNGNLFRVRIRANGFMHNMVRITVGTLLDIGKGRWESRSIESILEEEDRRKAGMTLPPYGLYFVRAYYEKFPEINELYKPVLP
ncbi:tRNA pseudouridine(38-40) synthase TruA [Leptospira ilyithenensis]|uniref:tRNA pseudouridine synthase A n=1 Tax=Leptospira ilyithenensis TaxID=2484901 RepID=A0A4R9LLK6_9LEPT|nr:tRNA pseudouridine(38-40) synthase TruA [Leptospira ilyithenensis]TGN06858.1 tRNA pseudouridine(38-40) synthase TruA [Leptospira ilyithenensis]